MKTFIPFLLYQICFCLSNLTLCVHITPLILAISVVILLTFNDGIKQSCISTMVAFHFPSPFTFGQYCVFVKSEKL